VATLKVLSRQYPETKENHNDVPGRTEKRNELPGRTEKRNDTQKTLEKCNDCPQLDVSPRRHSFQM
jgi:hypothetical protein